MSLGRGRRHWTSSRPFQLKAEAPCRQICWNMLEPSNVSDHHTEEEFLQKGWATCCIGATKNHILGGFEVNGRSRRQPSAAGKLVPPPNPCRTAPPPVYSSVLVRLQCPRSFPALEALTCQALSGTFCEARLLIKVESCSRGSWLAGKHQKFCRREVLSLCRRGRSCWVRREGP